MSKLQLLLAAGTYSCEVNNGSIALRDTTNDRRFSFHRPVEIAAIRARLSLQVGQKVQVPEAINLETK